MIFPYNQPYQQQPVTYTFGAPTLEQIREVIREEVRKALHPEEARPSAIIECEVDGKRYKGVAYLVEDDDEDEEDYE